MIRAARSTVVILGLWLLACGCAQPASDREAAAPRMSVRMADSTMARHPTPALMEDPEPEWRYSSSFAVHAIARLGVETGEQKYVDYARKYMEPFVDDAGRIAHESYDPKKYRLDDVVPGRVLLLLHEETRDPRFLVGPRQLAEQLKIQPRTKDGGYWHKQIYPHQLWLDGIFMDCPFMVEFAQRANEPQWHDEAVNQILTIAKHTRDPKTGLFYHGYDESRQQKWANPQTGTSPCFWGRAVGWYALGIVETLRTLPANHPRRGEVLDVFRALAEAITKVQDEKTGLWWQVLDQPNREGNYLESSASSMFVYALAAGARHGYLDRKYAAVAKRGYDGILKHFIETDPATGHISLKDTCQVAGLGGRPYRDGSFAYYIREPRISNDPKGVAPFILAAMEMERSNGRSANAQKQRTQR